MKCYECDGLGFLDEEDLEDIEISHKDGFISKIERFSVECELNLVTAASAWGYFYSYIDTWVLCPYCEGSGKE